MAGKIEEVIKLDKIQWQNHGLHTIQVICIDTSLNAPLYLIYKLRKGPSLIENQTIKFDYDSQIIISLFNLLNDGTCKIPKAFIPDFFKLIDELQETQIKRKILNKVDTQIIYYHELYVGNIELFSGEKFMLLANKLPFSELEIIFNELCEDDNITKLSYITNYINQSDVKYEPALCKLALIIASETELPFKYFPRAKSLGAFNAIEIRNARESVAKYMQLIETKTKYKTTLTHTEIKNLIYS